MGLTKTQKIISYILKAIIIISATVGTYLSALGSIEAFMGGETVFMYFTIQSNIAIAIVSLIGIYFLATSKSNYAWSVIKFVFTISITLTGIVYTFVLAPSMGNETWNIQNVLTHVVVPICSIIDFFIVGRSLYIKNRDVLYVVIPPLLYAIYAGIGYVLNWRFSSTTNYPYFFLNWGSKAGAIGFTNELPFIGVIWWILLLFIFLILVGLLYIKVLNTIKKKQA